MIQLDTHVVVWLAARQVARFSVMARRIVERERLEISPMVVLELDTLHEAGRMRADPDRVLAIVERDFGLSRSETRLAAVVEAARSFAWTRDPFDRLIVASAMADGVRLLTADEKIRANFKHAVW